MRPVLAFLFICFFHPYNTLGAFIDDNFGGLEIGKSFNISWNALTRSPVTLELWGNTDPAKPLQLFNVTTIAVVPSGNSFQWEPASSLQTNITYAMFLDGAGDRERSQPFTLVSKAESSSSTLSLSSSASTSMSSSTRSSTSPTTTASTRTTPSDLPSQPQSALSSSTTSSELSTSSATRSSQTSKMLESPYR